MAGPRDAFSGDTWGDEIEASRDDPNTFCLLSPGWPEPDWCRQEYRWSCGRTGTGLVNKLHRSGVMSVVVLTGHRIDEPGREKPRFPPERTEAVAAWIARHMTASDTCFSSCASGADILFGETCRAIGARHHIVLPFEPERFIRSSVATSAPGNWEARFRALWSAANTELRHVLELRADVDPYDACNRELLAMAATKPPPHRLLAIWDGRDNGRPGGTGSMVRLAREEGFKVDIFDPRPEA